MGISRDIFMVCVLLVCRCHAQDRQQFLNVCEAMERRLELNGKILTVLGFDEGDGALRGECNKASIEINGKLAPVAIWVVGAADAEQNSFQELCKSCITLDEYIERTAKDRKAKEGARFRVRIIGRFRTVLKETNSDDNNVGFGRLSIFKAEISLLGIESWELVPTRKR